MDRTKENYLCKHCGHHDDSPVQKKSEALLESIVLDRDKKPVALETKPKAAEIKPRSTFSKIVTKSTMISEKAVAARRKEGITNSKASSSQSKPSKTTDKTTSGVTKSSLAASKLSTQSKPAPLFKSTIAPKLKTSTVDSKKTTVSKPTVHSEVYCESSSYTVTSGHYHKEQHAEHKVDGKVVFKKDLVDEDGQVTGKEVDWDTEGHKHIKEIGCEPRH